jgi:SAM-dependent methyltransferase
MGPAPRVLRARRRIIMGRPMYRKSAYIYDLLYDTLKDYSSESTQLHELIQAHVPGARSLLDVACGTGAHLTYLRQWYEVAGVDLESAMLDLARRRLPDVPLVEGDMRSFQLARTFDVVTCLFSAVGYMSSVGELDEAVTTMAAHLSPNGVLIVDGWVRPEAWHSDTSAHLDTAQDDVVKVARIALGRREGNKTLLDMHHLIAVDGSVDYVVEHHELTLFERAEYLDAFHAAGLEVEIVESPMPDRDRYVARTAKQPDRQPRQPARRLIS